MTYITIVIRKIISGYIIDRVKARYPDILHSVVIYSTLSHAAFGSQFVTQTGYICK